MDGQVTCSLAAGSETTVTFSVNLNALRGLPPFLDRRARDLATASSYVRANTNLTYGSGLANILGRHERNVTLVSTYLSAASTQYAETDSTRLRAAIDNYARADARAAARYDDALPQPIGGTPNTPLPKQFGPEVFDDRSDPSSALVAPADHHSDIPYKPSWYDLLSPASMLRDLIWKLTGVAARLGILDRQYDPFEFFVDPYVGDWAGLLRSAEVFEHVADFVAGEANELDHAVTLTPEVWHGNAAGICLANLGGFKAVVSDGSTPLRDLARAYRAVASGVHDNEELMSTALTSLIDCVTEGIVDIDTGGLFSAYEMGSALNNFIRTLRVALHIVGTLQDIVSAGFNISDEAMHRLGILNTLARMPALTGAQPAIPTGP
jgi:hypothetical protein